MSFVNVKLKPTYEVPLNGLLGAGAQNGFVSDKIDKPFRVNGVIIVFDDDHVNLVDHYLLTGDTNQVSTASISTGVNLIPSASLTPFFVGDSMIRKVKIIKEFPDGARYLKCHVINNNAYQIRVNISFIIEEI